MTRLLALIVTLAALVPAVATAQTPTSTPMPTSCAFSLNYQSDLLHALDVGTPAQDRAMRAVGGKTDAELAGTRPDTLRAAAAFLDAYATELEAIEPEPDALSPLHARYTERAVLVAHLLRAYADGDVIAALGYESYLDDNTQNIKDEVDDIISVCGDTWWGDTASRLTLTYPVMPPGWSDPSD